jgi:FkbM family methyltransferase
MKARVRRAVHLVLRSPLGPPALAAIRAACRRLPATRASRAVAYYAGEHLAGSRQALTGRVPTGSSIELLARDRMHRHIYLHGVHEPPTTRFLMSAVKPGHRAVDIGANAGYFALLLADLVGPGGSVHAFEPNPELFALLGRSARVRNGSNLVPVQAALGEREGTGALYLSPDASNSGLSTMSPDVAGEGADSLEVATRTLDGFCAEFALTPDLVKIDVEGHELAVLAGARRLLKAGRPRYVICELETSRNPAEPLLGFMAGYGYRACSLTGSGLLQAYEDREVQNVVFVSGA